MKKFLFAAVAALLIVPSAPAYADDPIPALFSVSPTSGDIDGGNTVTLTGRDFVESTIIRVDGVTVPDTLISSTEITIVMPAHSAGRVSIAAFAGMSGAVLPNAYEYIDIPDPEPSPTPTPTPTTEPTATPTPTVTPTPTLTPSPTESATPDPTPTPSISDTPSPSFTPAPSVVSVGSSSSSVQEEAPKITFSSEPAVQNQVEEVRISLPSPSYDFGNSLLVYSNSSVMNVSLSNLNTVRKRFTLQKRVNSSWKTISISYRDSGGDLMFYGIPLSNGSYRIVNAGKPIRWFRINNVIL